MPIETIEVPPGVDVLFIDCVGHRGHKIKYPVESHRCANSHFKIVWKGRRP